MTAIPTGCNVYSVGVLADLQRFRVALTPWAWRPRHTAFTRATVPAGWRRRHIVGSAQSIRRSWRRRSSWNGYLAEPTVEGLLWHRCGHGWTKRRALASLKRHVGEVQW